MIHPHLHEPAPLPRRGLLGLAVVSFGLLAGCGAASSGVSGTPATPPSQGGAAYPRTVDTSDGPVEIRNEARSIACLSPDVADVAFGLGAAARVIAVPRTNTKPAYSLFSQQASGVAHVAETEGIRDPEQVLSYQPDLVMLTTRHTGEADAHAQLKQAGVPMIAITNKWDSPEVFAGNVTLIGRALGLEQQAADIVADHRRRWDAVLAAAAGRSGARPVVGMVRTLGENLWLTGPGTIGDTAITAAGGVTMISKLGLKQGVKLEIEQLVKANPDVLVLVDTTGRGEAQYADLLASPGIAQLRAVQEKHLITVTSAELASGVGGIGAFEKIAAGLEKVR